MTEDHHRLGAWCHKIRRTYQEGKLSDEWFEKLSALNFRWESNPDLWEEGFQHAKAYYEEYGNLKVIKRYKSEDGYNLRQWVLSGTIMMIGGCGNLKKQKRIMRNMVIYLLVGSIAINMGPV